MRNWYQLEIAGCHPGVVMRLGKPAKKNIVVETFSTVSIFEVIFDKGCCTKVIFIE